MFEKTYWPWALKPLAELTKLDHQQVAFLEAAFKLRAKPYSLVAGFDGGRHITLACAGSTFSDRWVLSLSDQGTVVQSVYLIGLTWLGAPPSGGSRACPLTPF